MKKEKNSLIHIELIEKGKVKLTLNGDGRIILNLYSELSKQLYYQFLEQSKDMNILKDKEKEECSKEIVLDACKRGLGMETEFDLKLKELKTKIDEMIGDDSDVL